MDTNNSNNSNEKIKKIIYVIFIIIVIIYYFNSDGNIEYVSDNDSNYNNYSDSSASNVNNYNNYASNSSSYSGYDSSLSPAYTGTIRNKSTDKYTLMIYMCGSNLESDGGYASSDLEEMLKSQIADELNVLVYTGGAKRWYDYGISNRTNQIYKVEKDKLIKVKDNIGVKNMGDPNTLKDFMNFAYANFKADKYSLIFWDHGGGALSGFGSDENSGVRNDSLTIDEIKSAIGSFPAKLEFVGFDACLMANVETAYALKDNANYLIASEETEPGNGWDYISVLNCMSSDSSQDGATTGKAIVDSFIKSNGRYFDPAATLSTTNLSKIDKVYSNLVDFLKDIKSSKFDTNNYNQVSKVIYNTKAFADGQIDTFDLMDFASNINVDSSKELISALKEAVAYNKINTSASRSNGLSILLPNKNLAHYERMLKIYQNIGMSKEYTNVLTQYANFKAGGQKETYTANSHEYTQPNYSNVSATSWFDTLFLNGLQNYYQTTQVDTSELKVVDKGDYYALQLSKEDWRNIVSVKSAVWYDDGKGYIDVGTDSYYEMDKTGDLKVEFDGYWTAIDGQNVYYEVLERTNSFERGRVPAVINKTERVNLILYYDDKNYKDGIVLGYQPDYANQETPLYEKGVRKLKKGDTIDFVAPYYDYDGNLEDEYYIGETITYTGNNLEVSYEYLGDGECYIYYILTDIYDNEYYTEPIIVY